MATKLFIVGNARKVQPVPGDVNSQQKATPVEYSVHGDLIVIHDGHGRDLARENWDAYQNEGGEAWISKEALIAYLDTDFFIDASGGASDEQLEAVKNEAKQYTDSAIADVEAGVVQDGSITPVKTSFISTSENLFDPNDPDIIFGAYANSNNNGTTAQAGFNVTGYMKVVPGQKLSVSYKNGIQFLDANKAFVSFSASGVTAKTIDVPAGAAYARATVSSVELGIYKAEMSPYPTPYTPFGGKVEDLYLPGPTGFTTGAPELFLKEPFPAEIQVVKIQVTGDSIMDSGFRSVAFPDEFSAGTFEQGYGRLNLDGLARRLYNKFNYNKPIWRNCRHTAWTYTGTVSNINSGSAPYADLMKLLNDASGNTAEITITGKETVVFVFEGGAKGQSQETGVVGIQVSVNGGDFVNPSALLKGKLTKKGFGTTKIYENAADTFDTSFTAQETLQTDNRYAPETELFYNSLVAGNTYVFRITRAGGQKPVRLWGCYYFTGQTLIVTNRSKPGFNWLKLERQLYTDCVLAGVTHVIMEAPMYHDASVQQGRAGMQSYLTKAKAYGIEKVCMLSCPPGGVCITGRSGAISGDENAAFYPPGMNFYTYFNRLRKFVTATISSLPKYGDVYSVTIGGTVHNVTIMPGVTATQLNVNVLESFPQRPAFPLTLTKVSGDSGSAATITVNYQLDFYTMEQHRDMIKEMCYSNNLKFIDLLQAFANAANIVGERLSTPSYNMDTGHPLYASVVAAAADPVTYPNLVEPYQMNYMSNYFNSADSHHLAWPGHELICNVVEKQLF